MPSTNALLQAIPSPALPCRLPACLPGLPRLAQVEVKNLTGDSLAAAVDAVVMAGGDNTTLNSVQASPAPPSPVLFPCLCTLKSLLTRTRRRVCSCARLERGAHAKLPGGQAGAGAWK